MREVRVAVATILEKTLDSALFYQDKVSLTCKLDVSCFYQMFSIVHNKMTYNWCLDWLFVLHVTHTHTHTHRLSDAYQDRLKEFRSAFVCFKIFLLEP